MARPTPQTVARDIKALRVQGARKVAQAALGALVEQARRSKARSFDAYYEELLSAARLLEATRPTEPMMRNTLDDALRFTLAWARTHPRSQPADAAEALVEHEGEMLKHMAEASKAIAQCGANELGEGSHVLIHCHSSTLMGVLIEAQARGKNPKVTCLETRPLYQGRLSARELARAGVEVELAVDMAAGSLMARADAVMVGADAVTAEGDLINKIGTFTLAQLAHQHAVRFLCAAELFKYDPLTRLGRAEPIEQRDTAEVWGSGYYRKEERVKKSLPIPHGVRVLNPAFDRTPARLIAAYITEEGLAPPGQMSILAERRLAGAGAQMPPQAPAAGGGRGAEAARAGPGASSRAGPRRRA